MSADGGTTTAVSEGEQETKRIFCNSCKSLTKHLLQVRHSFRQEICESQDDQLFEGVYEPDKEDTFPVMEHTYSLWACAGCAEPTLVWQLGLRGNQYDDELTGLQGGYFPARAEGLIQPKQFQKLNDRLKVLYREIVISYNENCLLLCAIGLRALIEGICADKGITDGNLEHRVDELIKFLPSINLIEALHAFRFAGNDAAHRLQPLAKDEAKSAIAIMEDLLNFFYDLDYKASRVRSKRAGFKSVQSAGPLQ